MTTRVLLITLALSIGGCQKVHDEKLEYGPEVSKASINAALAGAMSGITAANAHAGQTVAYLSTRRIGDSNHQVTLGAATMSTVADPEANGALKLVIDTTARAGGQMKTTRSERRLAVNLVAAHAAATDDTAVTPTPAPRVTYHRLRTATESVPAPASIRTKENCAGLPGCVLSVRFVLFDVVAVSATGHVDRVSMRLGFSPQTPYLPYGEGFDRFNGALVIDCRSSHVTLDGRSVAVEDCRQIVDYQN